MNTLQENFQASRKQSISEGAMTALGISKRQEYYNRERRHWRGADVAFT